MIRRSLLIAVLMGAGVMARAQSPGPHAEQEAQFGGVERVPFYRADVFSMSGPPRVGRQVLGFLPYWVSSFQVRWDLLTQLVWFSVGVSSTGTLSNTHGWPDLDLIAEAHANGVKVTLGVTNFDATSITTLLSSATNRTTLVDGVLQMVQQAGADGVNIDLEGVPVSQKANLSALMIELTDRFHSALPGSLVTIDTPSVDWAGAFDYDVLAENSDGLMIMAYGYGWSGSPNATAVSPLAGGTYNLEWTVQDYLHYGGSQNRDKFILGLPWYGYDWPTVSLDEHAATTAKGSAVVYSSAKPKALLYGRLWDDVSVTPWYRYTSGTQPHQAWYDDDESLFQKFELVNQNDFGGIGIWALGYDGQEPELWQAVEDAFVPASGTVAVR
jgi:spore germination protein YaaH